MNSRASHSKHQSARAAARLIAASRIEAIPDALERKLIPTLMSAAPGSADKCGSIGVWGATSSDKDGPLERSFTGDPWNLWADVSRIEAKGSRKRVVLIGESVARGFFYDPIFTPCLALQGILDASIGKQQIQVVDLARTDLLLDDLIALTQRAISLLSPDIVVLFAGNNWCLPGRLLGSRPEEIAQILRRHWTWTEVSTFAERRTKEVIASALSKIRECASEKQIPVVFVLPEFNLVDWQNEYVAPPLFANDPSLPDWQSRLAAMGRELAIGNLNRAEMLATELRTRNVDLDVRFSELLAKTALAKGHSERARILFESARDACISLPMIRSPRCFSAIQQTVRSFGERENFIIVDLPRLFAEHSDNSLPDRRLFHDYCHLTEEGIRLVSGAIAQSLLATLGFPPKRWKHLKDISPSVDDKTRATAHFLAGCHNARWGQPPEIIRSHFAEALRLDESAPEAFRLLLDWHLQPAPAAFCRSFHRMTEDRPSALRYFSLAALNTVQSPSMPMIEAVLEVLREPSTTESVWQRFNREHGIKGGHLNLLDPTYRTHQRLVPGLESFPGAYYRALEVESHFIFLITEPRAVELEMVCRMRNPRHPGFTDVALNGRSIRNFAIAPAWQRIRASIGAEKLNSGFNSLTIRWPENDQSADSRVLQATEQLEHGEWPTLFSLYGQMQMLSLRRR